MSDEAQMGRPTKYRREYVKQARKLCDLGATDRDLAEFFGVTERTIKNWQQAHADFFQSTKVGKEASDDRVEKSLYRRATGYTFDAVKIMQHEGAPIEHNYVEHVPPDVTACIFWLKNRRRAEWRDRHEVAHDGTLTIEQLVTQSGQPAK